jgi:hypothetical protein
MVTRVVVVMVLLYSGVVESDIVKKKVVRIRIRMTMVMRMRMVIWMRYV